MPFITKLFLGPLFFFLFISTGYAKSNDPFGDIYITKDFGDLNNCGPIAALMLSKYIKKELPTENLGSNIRYARKTAQKNADSYRWWRMSDIKRYFSHEDIHHTSLPVKDSKNIIDQLDKNGVVIINVNMNNLSRGSGIGKPYFTFPLPGGWGHFLVIVGYKEVGNKLLFEIHDSFVKKGNNRSYYAEDILFALKRYNPEILVVYKNNDNQDNFFVDSISAEDEGAIIVADFNSGEVAEIDQEYKFEIGIDYETEAKREIETSYLALIGDTLESKELIKVSLADGLESDKYNNIIEKLNMELTAFNYIKPEEHDTRLNITIASVEHMQK